MPLFDVLGLIPQGLQRQIADSIVDFVSEQAEKFLGDWESSVRSSAGRWTACLPNGCGSAGDHAWRNAHSPLSPIVYFLDLWLSCPRRPHPLFRHNDRQEGNRTRQAE